MTGLEYVLGRLRDGEKKLAGSLEGVAARHSAEHEVRHVTQDLAWWSHEHTARLSECANEHGFQPYHPDALNDGARVDRQIKVSSEPEPAAVALLEDLRSLYLMASYNSLSWEMLTQLAQAMGETELLSLATECHPQTLRQIRWANTMLKTLSPQVLVSM